MAGTANEVKPNLWVLQNQLEYHLQGQLTNCSVASMCLTHALRRAQFPPLSNAGLL